MWHIHEAKRQISIGGPMTVLQHLMHNVGELGVSDQITYDMISHLDAKVHNITGVQEVVGKHVFSLEETVMHQKRSMLSIEESTDILKRKQEAMNGRVVLLESDVKEHDQRLNTVEMKSDTLNQTQQVYWKRLRLVEVNSASRTKVDERMVLLIILIMATMAIHSMYNMCYYDGTNKY
ncbi:uncharacterized protein LOC106181633 [Lingula anatina]|uniref:Uncharacterized protein LOC106181633 n=1 Tax=Lingula anatina TaxID=7574 RepID=A0A1S3KFX4_LINAN|nr:uncharacterized protein LOC106181633 [Lingula anatina]|eukprot:XP_013421540.1 uncharacterized protein LOC106181633 [Lingula anatina]